MGGKQNQQQTTSSQTYTPAALQQLQDIFSRAQTAASTPYEAYTGQLTAGLSPTQQLGISNINAAYGTAQPYINQAANYAQQGAAPITSSQIQNYSNPFQQQVIDATLANINQTNARQQQQVVGNAALQGALGGDRVRVAQAQLAGQQGLANNQTLAGLNTQNYQQALAAAQADRAMRGQAAYTFGNLGGIAQNAALQGAGAQLQAGGLEQATQQAGLTSQYQQYLQRLAFPYQQAQFLAGIGLPAAGLMGGTTQGQSTTQGPQPNVFGQILGGAATLASLFKRGGKVKGYEGGGAVNFMEVPSYIPRSSPFSGLNQQHQPTLPNASSTALPQQPTTMDYARLGMNAGRGLSNIGSGISDIFNPSGYSLGNSGGTGLEGYGGLYAHGGTVRGYDDGGFVDGQDFGTKPDGSFGMADNMPVDMSARQIATPFSGLEERYGLPAGYLAKTQQIESGANPYAQSSASTAGGPFQFIDKTAQQYGLTNKNDLVASSQAAARLAADNSGYLEHVLGRPPNAGELYLAHQQGASGASKLLSHPDELAVDLVGRDAVINNGGNPNMTAGQFANMWTSKFGGGDNAALPIGAQATQYQQQPSVFSKLGELFGGGKSQPIDQNRPTLFGQPLTDQRLALLGMGLGMMASPSPYLGVQIGQGGLQGLQMMQQAHQQELQRNQAQQKIDLQAQQMMRQAQQFAQQFGLQEKEFGLKQQEAMKPVLIRQDMDMYGRTHSVYGVRGPDGFFIDPTTGKRIDENSAAGDMTGGVQKLIATPRPDNLTKGEMDWDYINKLKEVNPALAADTVRIFEGEGKFPTISGGRGPGAAYSLMLRDSLNRAGQVDETTFAQRQKQRNDWTTNGKAGQTLSTFNFALRHTSDLGELTKGLNESQIRILNSTKNWINTQFSDPQLEKWRNQALIVATEVPKMLRGAGVLNEQEEKRWNERLLSSPNVNTYLGGLGQLGHAMNVRNEEMVSQYKGIMKKEPDYTLSPEAKAAMAQLEKWRIGDFSSENRLEAPKEGDRKKFKQGWGVFKNGQWVPE